MIPPFFLQLLKHHVRNHLLDISPIKSSQLFQHMEWMTCSIKSHPPAYGVQGKEEKREQREQERHERELATLDRERLWTMSLVSRWAML